VVHADGQLLTGQNPQSAHQLGIKVVESLKK
ncbi:type 1 glutamine amidotransferase domain-containing protein, partial [Bifidobacterium adolescentis]